MITPAAFFQLMDEKARVGNGGPYLLPIILEHIVLAVGLLDFKWKRKRGFTITDQQSKVKVLLHFVRGPVVIVDILSYVTESSKN